MNESLTMAAQILREIEEKMTEVEGLMGWEKAHVYAVELSTISASVSSLIRNIEEVEHADDNGE